MTIELAVQPMDLAQRTMTTEVVLTLIVLILVPVFTYLVGVSVGRGQTELRWRFGDHWRVILAVITFVAAPTLGFAPIPGLLPDAWWSSGLAPEIFMLGITVLLLDRLYQDEADRKYKREILDQLGSEVNEAAREAARIAEAKGWLTDGSLKGIALRYANLKRARLDHADLECANLRHAKLTCAVLWNANLEDTDLSGADLRGASLVGAYLYGATMVQTQFQCADLGGAVLVAAQKATLVNFESADLRMTNLQKVEYIFCIFHDAIYDNGTLWPEGLDPRQTSALNWGEMDDEEQNRWRQRHDKLLADIVVESNER